MNTGWERRRQTLRESFRKKMFLWQVGRARVLCQHPVDALQVVDKVLSRAVDQRNARAIRKRFDKSGSLLKNRSGCAMHASANRGAVKLTAQSCARSKADRAAERSDRNAAYCFT